MRIPVLRLWLLKVANFRPMFRAVSARASCRSKAPQEVSSGHETRLLRICTTVLPHRIAAFAHLRTRDRPHIASPPAEILAQEEARLDGVSVV